MERMTMSNDAYTQAVQGLEMLREENAHIFARTAVLQERITMLNEKNNELTEDNSELRAALGTANGTTDKLSAEIDQLKARLEVPNCSPAYRKTNDELAAECNRLAKELADECNRLAKELAAERRTNENPQRGNSKLLTDLSIARGENSKLRNTLRAVKFIVNTVLVSSPLAPREATRAELDYWEAEKNRSES